MNKVITKLVSFLLIFNILLTSLLPNLVLAAVMDDSGGDYSSPPDDSSTSDQSTVNASTAVTFEEINNQAPTAQTDPPQIPQEPPAQVQTSAPEPPAPAPQPQSPSGLQDFPSQSQPAYNPPPSVPSPSAPQNSNPDAGVANLPAGNINVPTQPQNPAPPPPAPQPPPPAPPPAFGLRDFPSQPITDSSSQVNALTTYQNSSADINRRQQLELSKQRQADQQTFSIPQTIADIPDQVGQTTQQTAQTLENGAYSEVHYISSKSEEQQQKQRQDLADKKLAEATKDLDAAASARKNEIQKSLDTPTEQRIAQLAQVFELPTDASPKQVTKVLDSTFKGVGADFKGDLSYFELTKSPDQVPKSSVTQTPSTDCNDGKNRCFIDPLNDKALQVLKTGWGAANLLTANLPNLVVQEGQLSVDAAHVMDLRRQAGYQDKNYGFRGQFEAGALADLEADKQARPDSSLSPDELARRQSYEQSLRKLSEDDQKQGDTLKATLATAIVARVVGEGIVAKGPAVVKAVAGKVSSFLGSGEPAVVSAEDRIVMAQLMKDENLTPDTILYRVTPKEYVKDGVICGNPQSCALVRDIYNPVENPWLAVFVKEGLSTEGVSKTISPEVKASGLGVPSLNVAVKDPSIYAKGDFVKVGIRLGDILDQGGKIYPDVDSFLKGATPLIVTVPKGGVKVVSDIATDSPLSQVAQNSAKQVVTEIAPIAFIGLAEQVREAVSQDKSKPSASEITQAVNDVFQDIKSKLPGQPAKKTSYWENFIKEVLADEKNSNTNVAIDPQNYEFLVKQKVVQNRLTAKGGINSDFVKNTLTTDISSTETINTINGYILTTNNAGISKSKVSESLYQVAVTPMEGVDIQVPGTIKVGMGKQTFLPISVSQGSGKVTMQQDSQVEQNTTSSDSTNLKVVVFSDDNKNGLLDSNEKILPWAGVQIHLNRMDKNYPLLLSPGWNLIALTGLPSTPLTASVLLKNINSQGGQATTVSTLIDGAWKTYVKRGDQDYSGDDFTIELGKAYFVKVNKAISFKYEGQSLVDPIKTKLASGWNAVGLPKTKKTYQASGLIDEINTKNGQADAASRWQYSLWDSFVKKMEQRYGRDFAIENNQGYLIRLKGQGEFEF